MKIFIDTNIFFNNWMLKSAHFQLLSNYIKNTDSSLLISDVVIKETENKYKEELEKIKKEMNSLSIKIGRFTESFFTIDMIGLPTETYNFSSILQNYFPHFIEISCENINNKRLVQKAILTKRPFRDNEKGFRDAVIWHSLLKYISDMSLKEDIILITNNSSDFFEKKGDKFVLHDDLKDDLKELGLTNEFKIFTSLKSFNEENIDEELHGFVHEDSSSIIEQFGEILEEHFESFALGYMNNLSIREIREIFYNSDWETDYLELMKSSSFDVWEGMEDLSISDCYKIDNDRIAFQYSFNLRRCTFEFTLNTSDYIVNKLGIDGKFVNSEIDEDTTNVFRYPRTYFTGNGIISLKDHNIDQMNIDEVWMK